MRTVGNEETARQPPTTTPGGHHRGLRCLLHGTCPRLPVWTSPLQQGCPRQILGALGTPVPLTELSTSNGILHGTLLSHYKVMPQAEMGRAQATRPQGSERQRTKSQGLEAQELRKPSTLPSRQYLKVHRGLTKAETEKLAQGLGVCVPQELTTYLGLYLCVI